MASVTFTGTNPVTADFVGSPGDEAALRSAVITTQPAQAIAFQFRVERSTLWLRIGSTIGGMDIVNEIPFEPGAHTITFTPNVSPYHIQWTFKNETKARLVDFKSRGAEDIILPSPWAEGRLRSLRWAQSLNRAWLCDGSTWPQALERRGPSSWSLREVVPANGPFMPLSDGEVTLTPSGRAGVVTITSNRPIWASYDAGSLIKLVHSGQAALQTLDTVGETTNSIRVSGLTETRAFTISITGAAAGDAVVLERSVGNELSWQPVATYSGNVSTSYNDGYDNAIIYYRLRKSAHVNPVVADLVYGSGFTEGIARIHAVNADNSVEADVIQPFGASAGTSLWAFGAWGGRFGYPRAVALEDGRLWFFRGNEYWASASDDFENLAIGTLADEALSRTINGLMNRAEWAAGADGKILVGLQGCEASIGSSAIDEVLTPANVRARTRTSRGSHDHQAVTIDDHVAFISRSQERIYRFGYNPDRADYDAMDLTRLNRDLGRDSPFVELSYQYEPEPRIWAVREDGSMVAMVYDLAENVLAPSRYKMAGAQVLSVCAVPGQPEDHVWMSVRRIIAGQPRVTIEKLAPEYWDDVKDCIRLHSSAIRDSVPTQTFTGLDHLEGLEVVVWGDGRRHGPHIVMGGQITTDIAIRKAIIGREYAGRYKSPRLGIGSLSSFKQIKRLAVWIYRTAGGSIRFGRNFDESDMTTIRDTWDTDEFDRPVTVYTGDEEWSFGGETARDPRLCIEMPGPGPATILAIAPDVQSNER